MESEKYRVIKNPVAKDDLNGEDLFVYLQKLKNVGADLRKLKIGVNDIESVKSISIVTDEDRGNPVLCLNIDDVTGWFGDTVKDLIQKMK